MGKLLHNMDIQLCCFLAGIYVCVHLFGCQNKSMCFQKFKSSTVFYICVCTINDAGREATSGHLRELAAKRLVWHIQYKRTILRMLDNNIYYIQYKTH